jgi:hypothetical protein
MQLIEIGDRRRSVPDDPTYFDDTSGYDEGVEPDEALGLIVVRDVRG